MTMTEDEAQSRMGRHGITTTHRVVYHYQGQSYGNLTDALRYATLVTSRVGELAAPKPAADKRTDRE